MRVSNVAKFIVAAISAGVLALGAAITDNRVTPNEAVGIGLAILTALGVYVVPNTSGGE